MHIHVRAFILSASLALALLLAGLGIAQAVAQPSPEGTLTITLNAPAFEADAAEGIRLAEQALAQPKQAASEAGLAGALPAPQVVYSTDVDEGQPVLPHRLVTLILPPDAELGSLRIDVSDVRLAEAPGTFQVPLAEPKVKACAAAAEQPECSDPAGSASLAGGAEPVTWSAHSQTIAASARSSAATVTLLPYDQMRKWKLARLDYHPFRYDPASGKLTVVQQVTVRLTFQRSPALLDRTLLSDDALDDLAPQMAENYAEAKAWYEKALDSLGGPLAPAVDNDYLVLSTDAIYDHSNLGQYITFLREHGHSVSGLSTARYGGKSGQALAEAIRADLQALYPAWHLRFVLLVGNPDPVNGDVPMRQMYPDWLTWTPTPTEPNEVVPTDLYYASLGGNWDLNGDGHPGEAGNADTGVAGDFGPGGVSFAPTLFVGRIPVYNNDYAALNAILQKLMDYQSVPGRQAYRDQAILANSFWGVNYDGANLGHLINQDFLAPNGVAAYRIYSNYPKPASGTCVHSQVSSLPHEANLGSQTLQNRWASNPAGLMVESGHGNVSVTVAGFGYEWTDGNGVKHVVDCWRDDVFNSGQAAALNDAMPAFTYHNSCLNGYPESANNIGYSLLRNGAVSTVSASRITWLDSSGETLANLPTTYTSAAGKGYNYVKRLMNGDPAGMALSYAASLFPTDAARNAQNNYDFNLYGDPAMSYYVGPFPGALGTPGSLAGMLITGSGDPYFQLAWKDYSNRETYYRITLSPTDGGADTLADVERDRVIAYVPTPACGKTYDIYVQAGNGANLSDPSNTLTLASQVCPPAAPANLYAFIDNYKIQLNWSNVANESGYKIYRRQKVGLVYTIPLLVGTTTADDADFTDASAGCYKTYVYSVHAYNASGPSPSSPSVAINSPLCAPPAPSGLGYSAGQTSLNLSWIDNSNLASNGEDGFEVWRLPPAGSWTLLAHAAANTTTFNVTGLLCGEADSSYKVAAYNNGGRSESAPLLAHPAACTAPAAPTNLAKDDSVNYPDSILLGWDDNSDNEWGFKIERQVGETWQLAATLGPDENSAQVKNLTCSASYTFRIYAYNGAGNSAQPYATASGATSACDPGVPVNFQGVGGADGIALTWDINRGQLVTRFDIERGVPIGRSFVWSPLASPDGILRTYLDTTAQCGQKYFYHIRAVHTIFPIYTSAYTPALLVKAAPCPPPAPSAISAHAISGSAIHVSWRASLARGVVDGYNVYRSPSGVFQVWTLIGSTAADEFEFSDTRLACGHNYLYRVAAFNLGGEGPSTPNASASTYDCPPAAPSGLARTAASLTGLTLAWADNSANEDGFAVQRLDLVNGWTDIYTTTSGVTSQAVSGLSCGQVSTFRVIAYNAGGDSTPSGELDTAPLLCTPELRAQAGLQGLVNLSWSDRSQPPAAHTVQRKDSPAGEWTTIGSASEKETGFRDLNAPCGVTLSYRILSSNPYSSSGWSAPASVTTTCAPTTVIDLSVISIGLHNITLTWLASSGGQTSFALERSTTGTDAWTAIVTLPVSAFSYNDPNLPPGSKFFYRLRAVNAGGDAVSQVVVAQTKYIVMIPVIRK